MKDRTAQVTFTYEQLIHLQLATEDRMTTLENLCLKLPVDSRHLLQNQIEQLHQSRLIIVNTLRQMIDKR